jgi:hypothetical protein
MSMAGGDMMKTRCIARAYGDEPLERFALGQEGGLVYLSNPSLEDEDEILALRAVGFPRKCVFVFESQIFDRLTSAYRQGDRKALESAWDTAKLLKMDLPAMDSLVGGPEEDEDDEAA